ncbi:MAG: outer membrane beta-barrel domain-containing protein [Cellvibrionaceae bacterium]|nr:outer membrane beta-barrel domain-containing protein [Cellvibrionaceae bacterium]
MYSHQKIRSLKTCLLLGLGMVSLCFAHDNHAQSTSDNSALDKIITPDLERRTISEDQLDSEDWEIGLFTGIFSIEDFGSNSLLGLRLAYHMTENFAIEFNYGATTAQESSIEVLGGGITLLSDDQRQYTYYSAAVVYNVLPGEVFIGKNTAFNNAFYISLGAGNTTFSENDYYTISFGGGLRFYLNDAIAVHATVKDHIFDSDLIASKTTHNIETSLGLSLYF